MTHSLLKAACLGIIAMTALSVPAFAQDMSKDRFQIRGRILDVIADGDGTVLPGNLATDVDHAITPEVDVTYFFTNNIAAELIAATSEHTISANGATVGDAWILPPTLTLQYHFTPDSQFSPYVGAGVNYSIFYGEDEASPFTDLDVDGGFGWALQAGFDYWLDDHWGLNLDAKYINLDVDVSVNNGALNANDVELDPFILGGGVSYRF